MRLLYVHNDYGSPSGEENAAQAIGNLLEAHQHEVFWLRRSSAEIVGSIAGKFKAFLAGIHNPFAARAIAKELEEVKPDIVQVQNLYPLLSPSIFRPIKERKIPVVMRCPNYRLFCPNGLHLSKGRLCESCLGPGRELWCVLKNCEGNLPKSMGYALRNAWARMSGSILRNVDMFIVQTELQKQKCSQRGIAESRIGIVPALVCCKGFAEPGDSGDMVTFVGRVSPQKGYCGFTGRC